MWKIDAQGKRTLMTTLGLRQRTRKLRNKLNRAVSNQDEIREARVSRASSAADLPLAGRQSAGANGEGELSRGGLHETVNRSEPKRRLADADHDR